MIDSLDTATIECPECKTQKILQLSQFQLKKAKTPVKVNCGCGNSFIVDLEKTKATFQETVLLGTFKSKGKMRFGGKMIIKKLNSKGLMLKTNIEQNILPGIKLFLEFVLDDAKQSVVKKEVVVKAKQGKYLSAEFTTEDHYDNLGPYLFFNKLYI